MSTALQMMEEPTESVIPLESADAGNNLYGVLVVLGYNGGGGHLGSEKHRSRYELVRRGVPNGIVKGQCSVVNDQATNSRAVMDRNRHTVSYSYSKYHTVIVEFESDATKDMFQIGRSSEPQIDFTVVDTWLATGHGPVPSCPPPPYHVSPHNNSNNKSRKQSAQAANAVAAVNRPFSSTISRYACRILASRDHSTAPRVFAAGFDASRNIFLGEKATKWRRKNGEYDGLTTNGVLVLKPPKSSTDPTADEQNQAPPSDVPEDPQATPPSNSRLMYEWHEVSVDGDIYTLRETRSSSRRGDQVTGADNTLEDGTLLDLCGATLLYRSAEGLTNSLTKDELEMLLYELNAGRPQCPVNLNTLIVPRRRTHKHNASIDRQPIAYSACGHVQGRHSWGHQITGPHNQSHTCPICQASSDRLLPISMGMESTFHIDGAALDHAFVPCGHVASASTVRYWSRIALPHGTSSFHAVCPFCCSLLSDEQPFTRLIFQDHTQF